MLDSISTAEQTESSLDETKVTTELERLTADEIRRMRGAIAAAERRRTDAAIAAAKVDGGARYSAPELVATCRAALSLALKGTRGMRLTADDYADLSGELVTAAMERGAERNISRGELPGQMPRRNDLADGSDVSWLAGAARRMLADLAASGASRAPMPTDDDSAADESAHADLTVDDLCGIVGMDTLRVRLAIRRAVERTPTADLAAECGKNVKATELAARKGREAIAASIAPRAIRAAAAAIREGQAPERAPSGSVDLYPAQPPRKVAHPTTADVLAYIDAVLDTGCPVPAATAEHADRLTRRLSGARRNDIARARPIDGPDAPTPEGIGRLLGARVRRAALEDMRRAPRTIEPLPYWARTTTGTIDTTGAESIGRPLYRPGAMNWTPERQPATVSGATHAPLPTHKAWGAMTQDITDHLLERRYCDLAARRAARNEQRAAAEQARKLTVLDAAERPADWHWKNR